MRTLPVRLLQVTPLHRQQSWPCHEPRRLVLSLVMPFLKDSKAALSDGMQPVPVPPSWRCWGCGAPAPPVSHKVVHMMVRSMGRGLVMGNWECLTTQFAAEAYCMNSTYSRAHCYYIYIALRATPAVRWVHTKSVT